MMLTRAQAARLARRAALHASARQGALELLPLVTTLLAVALLALVLWTSESAPGTVLPATPAAAVSGAPVLDLLTMPPQVAGATADRAAAILLLAQRAADSLRAVGRMAPRAPLATSLVVRTRPDFPAAMLGEAVAAARTAGFPRVELELMRE